MVNLGDEVEDKVSGFRGIVISKHTYLYGNIAISVQPLIDRYGVLPDSEIFYDSQLKVIKAHKKITVSNNVMHNVDYVFGGQNNNDKK